ncbi:MAG: low molecular weight protein-tyrosine-phosphatase [Oscillospiraceae bacterium]
MIKIMFVCHGNICRSTMAEFVFKHMVKKLKIENDFFISSSGTSSEELGNGVHYGTKEKLKSLNIFVDNNKRATKLKSSDFANNDYLIAMDSYNVKNIHKICQTNPFDNNDKIFKLLDLTTNKRDIADPWYTGNFDETYDDIYNGCVTLLNYLGYDIEKL